MSQSGFIAAMLLAAFVIWLAINNRLTAYTAVLFGPTQQPKPQGNLVTPTGVIGPAPTGAAPGATTGGGGGLLESLPDIVDTVASDAPALLEFLP